MEIIHHGPFLPGGYSIGFNIHSLAERSLSCHRSVGSSKASSPHSEIQRFLFQVPIIISFHSTIWSSCLRVPSCLLVLSVSPSITCYTRQFLYKMWPIHLAFFILCRTFLSYLLLCNSSTFFTRSVHIVFTILIRHRTLKLPRYL